MKLLITTLFSTWLVLGLGCAEKYVGENPPTDQFHFPTGVAISPSERSALVVSSNFDLGYNRGVVHSIDLERLDAALTASAGAPLDAPIDDAISDAVYIPSFGGPIRFDQSGRFAFVGNRGDGSLVQLNLASPEQGRVLDCGHQDEVQDCSVGDHRISLTGTDPYAILPRLMPDGSQRVYVGDLAGGGLQAVKFVSDPQDKSRLQSLFVVDSGLQRTSSVALLPSDGLRGDYLLMAGYMHNDPSGRVDGAYLRLFNEDLDNDQSLGTVPLVSASQAADARSVAVSPDGQFAYVTQRNPSSVALVDLSPGPTGLPRFQITAVQSIGLKPVAIEVDPGAPGGAQVLIACYEEQSLYLLDGHSLQVIDVLRDLGGGPADIAIDATTGRALVSLFDRDTILVVSLNRPDQTGLQILAQLGTPRAVPQPEFSFDPWFWL